MRCWVEEEVVEENQTKGDAKEAGGKCHFGDVFGIYYLITGDGYSMRELEDYAKQLRADLLMVEGVGKVSLSGAQREAIYVEISRERASALGVSIKKVFLNAVSDERILVEVEMSSRLSKY